MEPIIIHHLKVSQSERIPWLCEELGVPYELKCYKRDPILAPADYKALHPAGTAPVVQDGDITLAESCAVIEYIAHQHGGGRLFPQPADGKQKYADFLYWWHWVDGTLQPGLGRLLQGEMAGLGDDNMVFAMGKARFGKALEALDAQVREKEWLAGDEFSAADVMVVFSLSTMRYFYQYSLAGYDGILGYLQRIGQREAYKRAMQRCDPDMELALGAEPPKPFMKQV